MVPSEVQEIAFPPLTDTQIQTGLLIDSDAWPPAEMQDGIQAFAPCVQDAWRGVKRGTKR